MYPIFFSPFFRKRGEYAEITISYIWHELSQIDAENLKASGKVVNFTQRFSAYWETTLLMSICIPLHADYFLLIKKEQPDVVFLLNIAKTEIYCFFEQKDKHAQYMHLSRFIRGVVRQRADAAIYQPLHGAAVAINGKAIWITGARFAGKTTLLTVLLAYSQANFIANDQISLDETMYVYGWPIAAIIRFGTICLDSCLDTYVRIHTYGVHPFNDPASWSLYQQSPASAHRNSLQKLRFSHHELCNIFNKGITVSAPLKFVILPIYDPHVRQPEYEYLAKIAAWDQLKGQVLDERYGDPWYRGTRVVRINRLEEIYKVVPVLRLRYNEASFEAVGHFIDELAYHKL